jgi:CDP-glycerol glycerophosphotransferase (TagB/SpsB family)
LVVVDEPGLCRAETGVYQLLARSTALITDYSSIWTDYLAMERPIGFFCPDLEDYAVARGVDADEFRADLAGPLLRTTTELISFCESVVSGEDPEGKRRREVVERLGVVTASGATARLMGELARRSACRQ